MITLYVKTGCPFCAAVLAKVDELGIEIEEKNISEKENVNDLIEHGGKRQVPYMIDGDVAMYESQDIIDYLVKKNDNNDT